MSKDVPKFKVKDPLGRDVILKNDTWTDHILTKHGESGEEEIMKNIQDPCYILINTKPEKDGSQKLIVDETKNDYVSLTVNEGRLYVIKTIVDYSDAQCGVIATNYILRNAKEIKTTGGVLYDRKQKTNSTGITNF